MIPIEIELAACVTFQQVASALMALGCNQLKLTTVRVSESVVKIEVDLSAIVTLHQIIGAFNSVGVSQLNIATSLGVAA